MFSCALVLIYISCYIIIKYFYNLVKTVHNVTRLKGLTLNETIANTIKFYVIRIKPKTVLNGKKSLVYCYSK